MIVKLYCFINQQFVFKLCTFPLNKTKKSPNILFEATGLANLMFSLSHYPYQKDERANNFHLLKFCAFLRLSFLHDSNL